MPTDAVLRPMAATIVAGSAAAGQTQARLQYHKAILESYGITNLGDLGTLTVSGPVVPQPGLLTPAAPRATREVVFQSASRLVADGRARGDDVRILETVGGRALLLEPVPESRVDLTPTRRMSDPYLRTIDPQDVDLPLLEAPAPRADRAAARAVIPIDTAYWAADWVNLADNTTIVFKQPCRYLTIIALKMTVGSNVNFTWEKVPGVVPPTLPKPPKRPTAPTPDGLWGVTGEAGIDGVRGGTGPNGRDAPELEIWLLELSGVPSFALNGQPGVSGGKGQDGGDGGDGSKGRHELYDIIPWVCKSGPGNGGDGGPGGRAGDGGPGGHGGHGGRLSFYAPQAVLSAYTNRFYVTVDGGAGGAGGAPGTPGAGGAGGQRGDSPRNCSSSTPRLAGSPGPQGAPGGVGPAGNWGGHHVDGIGFYPITRDEFIEATTRPAIVDLSPSRAPEGEVVTVTGLRFTRNDRVFVGEVAAETTIVADTRLTFRVPAVTGGQQAVQVRQPDDTRSNKATLYVLPVLTAADGGERVRPGTTVTLVGSGFAPGALVRVDDQEMPASTFLDPKRLSFTLVRPSTVADNPAGERVTVRVVLADGTPSNELPLTLDTFRLLVIGDSILWGQGLQQDQKFWSLVLAGVRANQGGIGVYHEVRAHSGATIGAGDATNLPAIHGEVPTSYPTILRQVATSIEAPETVDLILMDGGINDVNILTFLNPTVAADQVKALAERYCYHAMKQLLGEVATKFSRARVVVTGYYPIVTRDSDTAVLEAFLIALGAAVGGIPGGLTVGRAKPRIVANCRALADESNARLRAAVDETNAGLGGQPRIFLAVPPFGSRNAALAPEAWLWGINADTSPQDNLVAGQRWRACNANRTRTQVDFCKRASAGHPNPRGAQEYAKAILAALPPWT